MSLSKKGKISYGVGALGKDFACGIVFTYLMFYFTDVVGLSPAFVGGLFLVARMWDAFNDPIMGMIVDNTRSKFGKFRPWILIGTLVNSVFLVLLFSKPDLEGIALHAYVAIVYILWGMTYTIMDIPFWAMIPSLSKNKEEREKIAVIPRIFACLAGLLMGTFGLSAISFLGKGNEILGYSRFSIVIVIIFVISTIVTVVNVKDSSKKENIKEGKNEKIKIKEMFSILKGNDQLSVFIKIVLCMNIFGLLLGGMALYYFTYVIGNVAFFPIFTGIGGITEMISLSLFPKLSRYFGREKLFKYSCIIEILGVSLLLVSGILKSNSILLIAISCIIFKFGSGMILASSTVMLADIVDYGEYKLGKRNESIIFSAQTLLVKLASAISGWLIGLGLSIFGYVPGAVQSSFTVFGMRLIMFAVPIGAVISMYLVYKKQYKLDGELSNKVSEYMIKEEEEKDFGKVINF